MRQIEIRIKHDATKEWYTRQLFQTNEKCLVMSNTLNCFIDFQRIVSIKMKTFSPIRFHKVPAFILFTIEYVV